MASLRYSTRSPAGPFSHTRNLSDVHQHKESFKESFKKELQHGFFFVLKSVMWFTKFVSKEALPLDGVPALGDLPAAVSQVEFDFPGDGVFGFPGLQQSPISHASLLLYKSEKHHPKSLFK